MQIPNTKASNIKKVKPGWWWFKNKHWDWKRKGNVFKPIGYRGILKKTVFKREFKSGFYISQPEVDVPALPESAGLLQQMSRCQIWSEQSKVKIFKSGKVWNFEMEGVEHHCQ